jgi:protein TonB
MLGYAVETRPARRKASPSTLALIIAGHAALILAVLNARTAVPERPRDPPIIVDTIKPPDDPAPIPPKLLERADTLRTPRPIPLDRPVEIIPVPLPDRPIDVGLPPIPPGPDIGATPIDPPKPIVRVGPKAATPDHALRPPYPEAKRRLAQEAVLRLRLSIDERGRVRAVEPLGAADPMFLASARSHLIRNWRYSPAMEGGRPVPSSLVITLRFELDQV